jgi:hypothetical protein
MARRRRTAPGRTSEAEISIAALRIARDLGGTATTTQLKDKMPDYINLTPGDLAQSPTRPNEKMYHQIVGNIVSHHEAEGNIISEGYAKYTGDGIQITESGLALLKDKGY